MDFQKASPFESATRNWSTEVDDLLPLDLDPYSRALSDHQPVYDDGSSHRRNHRTIMKNIGTDIVNGITICKFASGSKDVADDTVAVLSNNDKTVTIYSLTQQTTLKTLNLSIAINHASISPDGGLLVAVGDINKVWFYRRIFRRKVSAQPCYEWKEIAAVRLVCTIRNDWCFSTAWSPSGHLCAVASQFGTITIFETSKIREDMDHTDAVLHYMKSSRPTITDPTRFIPSAPRSMAFSPEPWDLLAWAEDHGRITIVDVRDNFASRQTIHVDVNSEKLEREVYAAVSSTRLSDAERELLRVRRRGQALLSSDFESTAPNAIDYRASVAAHRNPRSTTIHGDGQLLPNSVMSESERELLELLGIEQARDNIEARSATGPYSINYPNPSHPSLSTGSVYAPPLTFGQYLLARTDSTSNPASWSTPRRQDSFVMPQSISERASRASAAHPSSFTPGLTLPLSASPSRLSDAGANDTDIRDPEAGHQVSTLEAADNTADNHPPNPDEHRPRQRYLSNDLLRYSHLRGLERERGTEALSRWRTQMQSNSNQSTESRDLTESERFYREHARNWGRRIHELRERASQYREARTGSSGLGHEDTPSYTDDISNDIMLGSETISRMRAAVQRHSTIDEVDIQGIGWSWDGRYL